MKLSRRDFFNKIWQGTAAVAIPSFFSSFIIESCSNNSSNPVSPSSTLQTLQVTPQNNVISLKIDSSSPLASAGSAVRLQFSNGSLLVDRADQNNFNALSAICTHQACTITGYDSGNQEFICPCHGSVYNLSGGVVRGPAPRALPKYQTQFLNNQLDITL